MQNDKLLVIPEAEYHAASKRGEFLSSHNLAKFRESGPAYYRAWMDGTIPEKKPEAFAFGSAAHKFILEGEEAFAHDYVVSDGPVNEKTGEPYGKLTKAYKEWLDNQTAEVISTADYSAICAMNDSVKNHPTAKAFFMSGVPERVVRFEYCGKPCQIRMDWYSDVAGIVDFKSTSDLDWFMADIKRYGYVYQGAFYERGCEIAGIVKECPFNIVAVEKVAPYRTGVFQIMPEVLSEAAARNEIAIKEMLECERNNSWPTGYEFPRPVVEL